ncbi:MAG TPA: hypothetical protein VIW70_06740 [Rubrivivax sp.]
MTRLFASRMVVICLLVVAASWAAAADTITTKPLQFAKGASSATVRGTVKGYDSVDYKLRARAGQTMKVALKTGNASNYFNVLPPGSNDVAIFIGSTSGSEYVGVLPTDDEYTIRVYLMRNAARRNESADYTLSVSITGNASAGDAKVSGTPYHATGKLPCSMGNAPAGSQQCDFGVIRGQRGHAEVEVTPAGGLKRVLIFDGGKVAVGGSAGGKLKAGKSGDTWNVEVNDHEHYLVPEAVINGG